MEEYFTHGDEVDALIDLHDRSMSLDALKACEGRSGKVLVNLLHGWLNDEVERKTEAHNIIFAAQSMSISLFFSVLVSLTASAGKPKLAFEIAARMRDKYVEQFDSSIDELKRMAEAGE